MEASEIKQLVRMHILHPWAVNDSLDPKVIRDAKGVYLHDAEGNRIVDFHRR